MGKFRNAIYLPSVYLSIVRNLKVQKKFLVYHLEPLLFDYENRNDGSLSEKDFIKIRKYYGLAVSAILGEAFCLLRGVPMSDKERWTSTSQGIITGVFDDFFDEKELTEDHIKNFVTKPEAVTPSALNEELFLNFHMNVLSEAPRPNDVKKYMMLVYHNQVESLEQENFDISEKRIWEITQDKGGNSVLFYRSAYDNPMDASEQKTLYRLGTLMQLENDVFDVYKDYKDGIKTIPTAVRSVDEIRKLYHEQLDIFISYAYEMDYQQKNIRNFLDGIMPVINRGFVCLDQYKKLELENEGVFDPGAFTRKQLICDMEKPANILRTIYYQVKNTY